MSEAVAYRYEKHMVDFERGLKEAPEGAQQAVESLGGGRPGGHSVGFAMTEETGWMVLAAGQGPCLIWAEKDRLHPPCDLCKGRWMEEPNYQ